MLENKYRVVPAFEVGGTRYFMFSDQTEVPTGRQFSALAIYNEMDMRCDKAYLQDFLTAMKKVIDNQKKIQLTIMAQLINNMEERLNLIVLPEFIYKLASVVFFDESESPYTYDWEYNEKKMERWKKEGATLDFFFATPLVDLIPSLKSQKSVSPIYLGIAEKVAKIHREHLTSVLSLKE